ncbi:MAG: glycosyl transferase [Clostridia bacterium]|nr:glycosyl transferase [Clostridia bacterium]
MIPKIIHYCWFGRSPKPSLVKKCIKSWKKYCKGYEIIEWNEDNFSIKDAPLFVRQAYETKKWAFVSDYVRLYAMVTVGGIYMDTDVEVVKPLDRFLVHEAFSGFEDESLISAGIMACEKGFKLFDEFLHYYDGVKFILEDGSLNMTPNTDIIAAICLRKGLVRNNTLQTVEGFTLYPNYVFSPIDAWSAEKNQTSETVTIHWFAGSWLPEEQKKEQKEYQKQIKLKNKRAKKKERKAKLKALFIKIFGEKFYNFIRRKK